jgi:predicted alpha/beta hydrolase family esterase
MKRAIIVHCWEGYPKYCWYLWVKNKLEQEGFNVLVPAFPETKTPKQDRWVSYLAEQIGIPDDKLFLIGHSIGCITIFRYLETLSEKQRVGGVVFVAGFTDDLGFKELSNFFEYPLDFQKVKNKSKNGFIDICSDNDPYVALKYSDVLKEKLDAKVIIKHTMGHFSGSIENEASCTELPDVVLAVKKLSMAS